MRDNRDTLDRLFREGRIELRRGALFDTDPQPLPAGWPFARAEGMMLALAVGDSLGRTTEGMSPALRREAFGEVRDYLPHPGFAAAQEHSPRGYPSDDTQLAFWTLEQLIADRGLDPQRLAERFSRDTIFGIGSTVLGFLRALQAGRPWYEAGPNSAGNGALMRIAPMVIPHLGSPSSRLWADTALSAMITHNDSASIASCLAMVRMLWAAFGMTGPPQAGFWLASYVATARDVEADHSYQPRGGRYQGFQGPLWRYAAEVVSDASRRGLTVEAACEGWYSGAYLLETVPCVLYILERHGGDPEEAIVRAVNDTRDNDTVAAIVGAVMGALHGKAALPRRWLRRLSGRTASADDGRVFALLDEARRLWG